MSITLMHPWSPEQPVTQQLACTLIRSQFPQLEIQKLEPLGVGWDNSAFLINQRFVFRFPHRQLGADCMESEIHVLPVIADRLPLPVPKPIFIGNPEGSYPWSFAGYSLIHSRTACVAALNEQQRYDIAIPLARFLKALHSIPASEAEQAGAPSDSIGRMDFGKRMPQTRERIGKIEELDLFPSCFVAL